MSAFCPSCDADVTPEPGAEPRCPQCHRRLVEEDLDGAMPVGPPSSGRAGLLAAGLVVVLAVGAGAWWLLGPGAQTPAASEEPAKSATSVGVGADWRARFVAARLPDGRGDLPDKATPELASAAKAAGGEAGLSVWLDGLKGPGKLAALDRNRRRAHPVRAAGALYAEVVAAKAAPAHPIEVAWMVYAACGVAGVDASFVVDRGGVQTPLLLARTRVAVRTAGGKLLDPLGQTFERPEPVAEAEVATWWLILRAHAARTAGQFKDAHADLSLAGQLSPGNPAVELGRGVVAMDQGLLDKGLERCEAALNQREDALARLFLIDVLSAMQQPFKAFGHLEKALKVKPVLPEAWVSKGLLEAGRVATLPEADKPARLKEAEAAFRRALELDNEVPGARAGLAQVLYMMKDEAGAEKLLREAVATHSDPDAALLLTEILLPAGKAAEAAEMLDKLARDDDERVVQALARALVAKGDKEAALKVAERAHAAFPDNRDHALLRADLLRQLGRVEEAIAVMQPLKQGREGAHMAKLQAQLYLQVQKTDQAIANLEPLLKADANDKEAITLLIYAYLQADKNMELDALAARALAAGSLDHLQLAGIFLEAGDATRATTVLESAMSLEKPSAEAAAMLAMVYTASGRKAAALKLRDRMVAAAGDKGAEVGKTLDEAIAGAEAELAAMARESKEASERQPGGDAEAPGDPDNPGDPQAPAGDQDTDK